MTLKYMYIYSIISLLNIQILFSRSIGEHIVYCIVAKHATAISIMQSMQQSCFIRTSLFQGIYIIIMHAVCLHWGIISDALWLFYISYEILKLLFFSKSFLYCSLFHYVIHYSIRYRRIKSALWFIIWINEL